MDGTPHRSSEPFSGLLSVHVQVLHLAVGVVALRVRFRPTATRNMLVSTKCTRISFASVGNSCCAEHEQAYRAARRRAGLGNLPVLGYASFCRLVGAGTNFAVGLHTHYCRWNS